MFDAETTQADSTALSQLSQLLKASGDELRLEILRVLEKDSFGVLELCQIFDIKQSGMSHHLKVLAKAGLVATRKEGNSIFYHRAVLQHEQNSVVSAVFHTIDQVGIRAELRRNIEAIFDQRAQTSLDFFKENASRLKEQHELIADFDVYGARVLQTLESIQPQKFKHILEVGPGAAEFLPVLSSKAETLTALDNSDAMLELAREHAEKNALNNIEFVLGDTSYCIDHPNSVDCAVINMVLHHTPSPQKIFRDVSQALKENAVMIICDLCQHNQDWAREACGDLWLGFSPEDLTEWANECGLSDGQSHYFALRNGFQIQIRQFSKMTK